MIEKPDAWLSAWTTKVLGDAAISFAAPEYGAGGRGVGLYLLDLVPAPPPRGNLVTPLRLSLHYLLTTWAETAEEAHSMLTDLAFAALANSEIEVETEAVPLELWRSFGIKPRPALVLGLAVQRAQEGRRAPMVRQPFQVQSIAMTPLSGIVLGPAETPIAGARVEVPSLDLVATTDTRGRFYFPGLPDQPNVTLVVKARSRELRVTAARPSSAAEPLLVHFEPMED